MVWCLNDSFKVEWMQYRRCYCKESRDSSLNHSICTRTIPKVGTDGSCDSEHCEGREKTGKNKTALRDAKGSVEATEQTTAISSNNVWNPYFVRLGKAMDVPNIGAGWQCLGRLRGRQEWFIFTQTPRNWGQSCFLLWAASPWLCSLPHPSCIKQNNSFPKSKTLP